MRLEPYREAWHHLQSPGDKEEIEIHASADETVYPDSVSSSDTLSVVILSEAKDPYRSPALSDRAKIRPKINPVRLPKSAAPWPIPLLRILTTRKGKQILRAPD
jgi:hypothetical protein